MNEIMPLTTIVGFGLPPIGFIAAIIVYYLVTSEED
jgi:hypothetical protein